jgi:hypothetical protein
MFKEEKVENQKLHQVPVPTHPRSIYIHMLMYTLGVE